jgi:hypothetical protein
MAEKIKHNFQYFTNALIYHYVYCKIQCNEQKEMLPYLYLFSGAA